MPLICIDLDFKFWFGLGHFLGAKSFEMLTKQNQLWKCQKDCCSLLLLYPFLWEKEVQLSVMLFLNYIYIFEYLKPNKNIFF